MDQRIWNHRRSLWRTRDKIASGKLIVGFIGGSITDARPRYNWPEYVIAWLVDRYPNTRFIVENAAIGATGSDLGVLRAKRDLLDRGCDLVFVEYAVNDFEVSSGQRMATREGLLRKLLAPELRDVVLVHTYCQPMYQAMIRGEMPDSVAELERLAEHYGVGSVWMGLYALQEIQRGFMRWEDWLPDGLHPTQLGSLSYANSVIAFLEQQLSETIQSSGNKHIGMGEAGTGQEDSVQGSKYSEACNTDEDIESMVSLPEPLTPAHWGAAELLPLESIQTQGPWILRRWPYYAWIDQVLETSAVGARISFAFNGRGVCLGFDFGKASAEFKYRIDGGPWVLEERERPEWLGNDGWYRLSCLAEQLPDGRHHIELEVVHGDRPECKGTNFRLGLVGIIR